MEGSRLNEVRKVAVAAAAGTSDHRIKQKIIGLLDRLPKCRSILDYGAGKGELLALLAARYPEARCAGADYLDRPADLPARYDWYRADLNEPLDLPTGFQIVICSEVIEHLENPRLTFRQLYAALEPAGTLILSCPNQESLRSYAGLIFGGHFTGFLGAAYPAHITALLRLDLRRIAAETGFSDPSFSYDDHGGIPKLPQYSWQQASGGLLRGRLFSDTVFMVAQKPGSCR